MSGISYTIVSESGIDRLECDGTLVKVGRRFQL